MTGIDGVGRGAGAALIGSNGDVTAPVSAPQISRQTSVADLEARYGHVSKRLKIVQDKAQSVSFRQAGKLRPLLKEAATLRTSLRDLRRDNNTLFDAQSTTVAEAQRISELATLHVSLGLRLDNAQSTLATRAVEGFGDRLEKLERDVARFAASHGSRAVVERKRALEARVSQAWRDIGLVEAALDGLRSSEDQMANQFADVLAQSVDEQRARATQIGLRLTA